MSCSVFNDWSGVGVPGFQGNCYLVTNAQIRWMQQNGWMPNVSLAPDNATCPTKSQLETYCGTFNTGTPYTALSSSSCVPIGYFNAPV